MNESNKPVAIVLGGTNPHIELIHQLKNRGYFVILIDYLPHPPAKEHADLHLQESTMDQDRVLEIAREKKASLVISACVDQANITACYVAEKLGLTRPYSYEIASKITNKGCMKSVMIANKIPTTKYVYMDKGVDIKDFDLKYPVMVKPADSCAASGVKKAKTPAEMERFLSDAKNISRNGRTVVEEVAEGVEVSAYCFIHRKKAYTILISERISAIEGEAQVIKCYSTVTPPNITPVAEEKIRDAAEGIAAAFELDNTPLHVQAICDGDNINIIEFAPRVGGGISYETIRDNTGFDIISATIDSYLEKEVVPEYHPIEGFCSVNNIYGKNGVFGHVEGAEKILQSGLIKSVHFHKTSGAHLDDSRASSSRIMAFVVEGSSREEMCRKVESAMSKIQAYDTNGEDIMRKDLYLKS